MSTSIDYRWLLISLIILILNFSLIQSQSKENYWNLITPPQYETFHTVKMISDKLVFLAGDKLYEFDGLKWKQNESLESINNIDISIIKSPRNIWIFKHDQKYTSEIYHSNGRIINKFTTPLANTITAIDIDNNGHGWYSGFQELAYHDYNGWKFLPYPKNFNSVHFISGSKDKVWINTFDKKLYLHDGKAWMQFLEHEKISTILFTNEENGYALGDTILYEYKNKKWTTHSTSKYLRDILKITITDNEIWGVGLYGRIVQWKNGKWKLIESPTKEHLLDIDMLNTSSGMIAGVNGVILKLKKKKVETIENLNSRLVLYRMLPIEIELNDEYGVGISDLNGDGWNDIYTVCLTKPNRLFINQSTKDKEDKTIGFGFEDNAGENGVSAVEGGASKLAVNKTQIGVGIADVDNDGDEDIYVTNLGGTNKLYLNNGDGKFRDVSKQNYRGTETIGRWNSAIFGDVNNDGFLDLFITNEEGSNRLFINDGNGFFTDITKSSGLESYGGGMGATFGDVNGDGKLDLYVANWSACNNLYINISEKKNEVKFKECGIEAGVAGEFYSKSNGAAFADYDNDGDLDLFVTNRRVSNKLYRNNGAGIFEDVSNSIMKNDSLLSHGVNFADFDQDGFQDLFITNAGQNVLYKNVGGEKFVKMRIPMGTSLDAYDTGSALGDMDNDGDLDLYVCNYINGESKLYLNSVDRKNFILLNVNGSISNRNAIGAKVYFYKSGMVYNKDNLLGFREINGGSGYVSSNSKTVHYGLGDFMSCDIVVFFPVSGIRSVYRNVKAGTILDVYEESTIPRFFTLSKNVLLRFLLSKETNSELLKFALLLAVTFLSIIRGNKKYKWKKSISYSAHGTIILIYVLWISVFIYSNFLLNTFLPFFVVTITFIIIHLFYERIILSRQAKIEKQATRERIARDLHDDLAATLSSSVIYTQILLKDFGETSNPRKELLSKVNKLLNDASIAITDIIWNASTSNDKLEDLVFRLTMMVDEICKGNHIQCSIEVDDNIPSLEINEEVRRNAYLIFKEGLNNAVKHSKALHIKLSCHVKNNHLEIELADDGEGFETNSTGDIENSASRHGRGLRNIQKRADEIGAELRIHSSSVKGTIISLKTRII